MRRPSSHFKRLSSTVAGLRRSFLPRTFSRGATAPTVEVSEQTKAFLVLTHAAFERYFEDRVNELSDRLYARWKATPSKVTPSLLSMLAVASKMPGIPDPWPPSSPHPDGSHLQFVAAAAVKQSHESIQRYTDANNGIKKKNVVPMLCAVGLHESQIDPVLLGELDRLGTLRGNIAHANTRLVSTLFDPKDNYDLAIRVLKLVRTLDHSLAGV